MIYTTTSVILILKICLSVLISSSKACENVASISVKENIHYPSASLLDVSSILQNAHITSDTGKDSIYLTDLTGSRPFTLTNGKLSVSGPLDREQICSNENSDQRSSISHCCSAMCCMYISVTTGQRKTVYIKVVIEDENDNEPIFPQSSLKLQVHENVEVGYSLTLPKAEDLDSSSFGVERYEIVQDKSCNECFQVKSESRDGGPVLLVKTKIDREMNSRFLLQILAVDKGLPTKTGTLSVSIEVVDINDNSPQFEETSFVINVEENGRTGRDIKTIKVTDADLGINSQLSYTIEDYKSLAQKYFRVFPIKNGVSLLLQSSLDYESIKSFRFNIVAKDHGIPSLSSTVTVHIRVVNINDERPEIHFFQRGLSLDPSNILLQMPENGPKQNTIISVHVTDKDSKLSDISCEVSYPKDVFYLYENQHTNIVENKKLFDLQNSVIFDREVTSLYRISITCSDSNTLSKLTHSVEIQLRITDKNDNPPVFSSNFYFGKILETNYLDKVVDIRDGMIRVSDADVDVNSRITYSLSDIGNSTDSHKFSITPHYPQIKNIVPIDFEEKKKYVFIVMAKDSGTPSLSASATITVDVVDANDNRPEIGKRYYSFSVLEEEPAGTEIGRITATDADTLAGNKDLIYEIVNNDVSRGNSRANKLFLIENNTGCIKTRVALDHEKDQHINFMVKVRNTNDDSMSRDMAELYGSSVSVNVKIEDINDNAPKLVLKDNPNHDSTIQESVKRPTIIMNTELQSTSSPCAIFPYTFTDADQGINSEVRVSLVTNPNFHLEKGHNLICPKHTSIPPGQYTVTVIGEDRNGGNGSKKVEQPIHVIVKSSSSNKPQNHKKPPRSDPEEKFIDLKAIVIFIVLIGTIILFCFLLIIVVIKTKICIPRSLAPPPRNRDKMAEKPNNTATNKNYNVLIPEGSSESKRLCNEYVRSNINNQNCINSDYSNNLFFPRSDTPSMDILHGQYPNHGTLANISQSCEFMFPDRGVIGILPGPNHDPTHSRDIRYQQMMKTVGQGEPMNETNWDKSQSHQYNYLLEPRDSGSLPSNCGKGTPPKQDMMSVAAGYQKSINDVYLQTSFV